MSKTFFNTINLSGEALQKANARAAAQNDLIAAIFTANPDKNFSPSQIHKIFASRFDRHNPLTSIRRAISTLTKEGVLEKMDKTIPGPYAEPEHLWKLKYYDHKALQEFMTDLQEGRLEIKPIQQELFQ